MIGASLADGVGGGVPDIGGVHKAQHQVFVPSRGDAQSGASDDLVDGETHILKAQTGGGGHTVVPFGNFEIKTFAQKGLAGAEFGFGADAAVDRIEFLH